MDAGHLSDDIPDRLDHQRGGVEVDVVAAVGSGDVFGAEHRGQAILRGEPIGERDLFVLSRGLGQKIGASRFVGREHDGRHRGQSRCRGDAPERVDQKHALTHLI